MKKLKHIVLIALMIFATISCNEDKWLKEVPFDFYSPDNSYTTQVQFNAAVANLYSKLEPFNNNAPYLNLVFIYTSDIAYDAIDLTHQMNSMADNLKPEVEVVGYYWRIFYRLIFDANVIINRINNKDIVFKSEKDRAILEAEARFFRGYAYKNLGIIYGGVPIILDEIKEPKRDFVRAKPDEVWVQCINDLTFASQNLLDVTEQKEDGRLTKAAANHYLAELYIITKDYDKAITASSSVIDNPNYALMTQRFGTKKNDPGDVYGDLFKRGNQNRNGKGGLNKEAIWVNQYEYLVTGGGTGYNLTNRIVPNYEFLTGNSDKKNLFIGSTSKNGGKGMGWLVASDYLLNNVW
jgi:starch-binding outer membrane protein, SusD/RagB family